MNGEKPTERARSAGHDSKVLESVFGLESATISHQEASHAASDPRGHVHCHGVPHGDTNPQPGGEGENGKIGIR